MAALRKACAHTPFDTGCNPDSIHQMLSQPISMNSRLIYSWSEHTVIPDCIHCRRERHHLAPFAWQTGQDFRGCQHLMRDACPGDDGRVQSSAGCDKRCYSIEHSVALVLYALWYRCGLHSVMCQQMSRTVCRPSWEVLLLCCLSLQGWLQGSCSSGYPPAQNAPST